MLWAIPWPARRRRGVPVVDRHVIPYLGRHTIPYWPVTLVLSDPGWGCQGWGVDDVANLAGKVVGRGLAEANSEDGLVGAAPQPDQPDLAGGAALAAGAAVIAFDDEGLPAGGVGLAVSLGAAGRAAIEPGPPDRICARPAADSQGGRSRRRRGFRSVPVGTPRGPAQDCSSGHAFTQFPKVPSLICNSRAISAIGRPVWSTSCTASALN